MVAPCPRYLCLAAPPYADASYQPQPTLLRIRRSRADQREYVSHPKSMADGLRSGSADVEVLCAGGDGLLAQVRSPREWQLSNPLDSGGLSALRYFSSGTPARFRVHDSGYRR